MKTMTRKAKANNTKAAEIEAVTKPKAGKEKYALISGSLNRHGDLKKLNFVPGDFSKAIHWPKKTTGKTVFDHFHSKPGEPCRVPSSLAKKMFGFTDKQLWHEDA